jgi:hypothetical protein
MEANNKRSFKAIKGKTKVIKLRNGESIMDGNSVQTPFLAPYRIPKNEKGDLEPTTFVEYTWNSIEDGVAVQRGLKVSGHGELGVPTLKDKEVLRALQDIYVWSKIDKGILRLETDQSKIREQDLIIDFISIDNIATAMGYKRISGQQRQSIKESIERLVATTVFNTYQGGLYDPVNKRYITDSKKSYKYLDSMESYPTAWFCGGDRIAIALINALAKRNIRVPEDVSVVGFDDIEASRLIVPSLTTIHVKREEMASEAVDFLIRRMKEDGAKLKVTLYGDLVVRESVKKILD